MLFRSVGLKAYEVMREYYQLWLLLKYSVVKEKKGVTLKKNTGDRAGSFQKGPRGQERQVGSTSVSPPPARLLGQPQAVVRGVGAFMTPFPLLPAGLGPQSCRMCGHRAYSQS